MGNFCGRNSNYRYSRRKYIFYDDGASTNPNIVGDSDSSEDLSVLPDVNVVSDDRGVIRIAAIASDAAVAVDDAALADTGFGVDDDRAEVLKMQILSETAGTDNESQTGSQSVFPAAVPKTK